MRGEGEPETFFAEGDAGGNACGVGGGAAREVGGAGEGHDAGAWEGFVWLADEAAGAGVKGCCGLGRAGLTGGEDALEHVHFFVESGGSWVEIEGAWVL